MTAGMGAWEEEYRLSEGRFSGEGCWVLGGACKLNILACLLKTHPLMIMLHLMSQPQKLRMQGYAGVHQGLLRCVCVCVCVCASM